MEGNKTKNVGVKVEENGKVLPIRNQTELKHVVENKIKAEHGEEIEKNAESAKAPEAWNNQQKAYNDAWENNKNQLNED